MSSPLFIYVHGFNSSPESVKARLLGEYLAVHAYEHSENYLVPQLSHWPAEAMQQLESIVTDNRQRPIVLIGSSLGGYYSIWLTEHYENCTAVMVNPAIYP
ncbi:YqiA/YcfP family alpha/beta fold hydrolase, partial [Neptunomonas sp.]|uniref:YqiA/YcfP family alpha/beta fold hydrolase n=1 Tax=Neptunomonas sp. TaxID=1971898 RepID=UPI0035687FBF